MKIFLSVYLIACILTMIFTLYTMISEYMPIEIPKKVETVLDVVFSISYVVVCIGVATLLIQSLLKIAN